jgi:hypothetical protein
LFTSAQYAKLISNGIKAEQAKWVFDPKPVVKLFTPDGAATWLLTDILPDDLECAFGLCDLGFGSPELGSVSLTELSVVRGKLWLPIERDRRFQATMSLGGYLKEFEMRQEPMARCEICRQEKSESEFSSRDPGACLDCYFCGIRDVT